MRRTLLLLALLVAAMAPATAHAGWFGSERVDGPADIVRLGDVDLAREGGGGLVYVKRDAAGARVWLSRLVDGAWEPPAPISGPDATEAAVAAGADGRLALAWVQAGDVHARSGTGPIVRLTAGAGASNLVMDIGVNGTAFAVWEQGGDVRAAFLKGETWQVVPAPLDIDPARSAGTGTSRPRVAVAADGSALVVWGETMPDGTTHVFARRVYGARLSALPQDATLPGGGSADVPDVDTEYDRSYAWVVFRQGGRGIARRLRASTFEPAQYIDGGLPIGEPRVAISGAGEGHATVTAAGGPILGALLADDAFQPAVPLGAGTGAVAAFSDRNDAAAAWHAAGTVRGRIARDDEPFGAEAVLSTPAFGTATGPLAISSNRVGDVVIAMLQGAAGAYHVTVATHDINPSRPVFSGTRSYGPRRPRISWNAGLDYMGPQTFRVLVDGREVATTRRTRIRAPRLKQGNRRLQVIAVDRRGQEMASRSRMMRIDARRPRLRVRTSRSGRCVTVVSRARDPRGGRGMDFVRVNWGDKSKRRRGRSVRHCYRRGGRYTITVTARDRAGNKRRRSVKLRV